jgi:hypothetical protein
MPWGLRIRNQDRVIQFADNVICPVLVSKGSATATVLHPLAWFSGGGYNLRYVDLTYSGYRPILALRVTDLGTRVKRIVGQTSTIRNGNGTWTTRVFVAWLNYNNWPDDPVAGAFASSGSSSTGCPRQCSRAGSCAFAIRPRERSSTRASGG